MRKHILIGAATALVLGATPLAAASASPTASPSTPQSQATATATSGAYVAVKPTRILDTRFKNGVTTTTPIGAGQTVGLQVTGRGGVPASGVSAVVVNLTAVSPSASGYLTAYPTGQSLPATSSINFVKGGTRANLATVPLGTGGKLNVRNAIGSTHVLGDVVGYYLSGSTTATTGSYGSYQAFDPYRAHDSRAADDRTPLDPGDYVTIPLNIGPDYSMHVKAVAVNITAVGPTKAGYLTAWPGNSSTLPNTSTVNYLPGQTTPNMAIVPVTTCNDCADYPVKSFDVDNVSTGTTHVLVDIVGFFDDDTSGEGLRFKPLSSPKRIVDTRSNLGTTKPGAGQTRTVVTPSTIAGASTFSLVTNVTGVQPTAATYLTLWPNVAGQPRPGVSNLNPAKGSIAANMAIVDVGNNNDFNIYNGAGTTDVLVDVTGTMEYYLAPGRAGQRAATSHSDAVKPRTTFGPVTSTR